MQELMINQLIGVCGNLLSSNTFDNSQDLVQNIRIYILMKVRMYSTVDDYFNLLNDKTKGTLKNYNLVGNHCWDGDNGLEREKALIHAKELLKCSIAKSSLDSATYQ